jgi:hypothetical protein
VLWPPWPLPLGNPATHTDVEALYEVVMIDPTVQVSLKCLEKGVRL